MQQVDVEQLARKVGASHGLLLDKQDPILMIASIMREVLVDHEETYTRAFAQHVVDIQEKAREWEVTQKQMATKSLNRALDEAESILVQRSQDLAMNTEVSLVSRELRNLRRATMIITASQLIVFALTVYMIRS